MGHYRRLTINYISVVLTCPRCIILIPAVILFILSYNVLYEFSIKELNMKLASIFNNHYNLINHEYVTFHDESNFLTKITFEGNNLLSLANLNLLNSTIVEGGADMLILSPLNNFPIDLSNKFTRRQLRSIQSYLLKFFNYDLINKLPYLYFNQISLVDDLIDKVSTLSIYIIHTHENLLIDSTLSYTTKTFTNRSQIGNFINYYNYQHNFGSIYHFIKFSNFILLLVMILYCIYIYIALANQHIIRSSFGLLVGWLFLACTSAAASINLTAKFNGTCWKLLYEPSTTFTKLSYIFIIMIISANNLFKIISHVTNKQGKLHSQLLSLYINKWYLPLTFPNMLIGVLSLVSFIIFNRIFNHNFIHQIDQASLLSTMNKIDLCCQTFIYCFIMDFLMQSSYLIGIIVIDTKRISLTEVLKAKPREDEELFDDNQFDSENIFDGANVFSWYLLQMNTSLRPTCGLRFKLGQALLKVRYETNSILLGFTIAFLSMAGLIHSILILPRPLNDIIDPTIIPKNSFSALYYLELTSILSFTLAISLLIFKLTKSYTMNQFIRLDSRDFEIERKVFNSIELENGHDLDIIKVKANPSASFVISIGLDHKIFIWSPLANEICPINIATTFTINENEDLDNPLYDRKQPITQKSYLESSFQNLRLNEKHKQYSNEDKVQRYLEFSSDTITEGNNTYSRKNSSQTHGSSDDLSSLTNERPISPATAKNDNITSPASSIAPSVVQITKEFWPINHVNISDDGNYIILLNQKYGLIKCYERKQLKYIWECKLPRELSKLIQENRFKILESFFRKKTVPGFLARKILQRKQLDRTIRRGSEVSLASMSSTVNGNLPPPPPQRFITSKGKPINDELNKLQKEEFIMLLETGHGLIINCLDGAKKHFNVLASAYPDDYKGMKLISAKKVVTPRINDRIAFQVANEDDLIIATAVNNNWKFRVLTIREGYYNQQILPISQEVGKIVNNNDFTAVYNSQIAPKKPLPIQPPKLIDSKVQINKPTLVTVQFVGMVVRVKNLIAELIDIQTGIILKSFSVGRFKTNSFRVSHSEPTHCKFCGCACIQSFSIVYEDYDTTTIILHTFKIDIPKSKNNICLRVERDPREIRCIGFNAVTEHQYWYDDIEGWELTDVNMIIGMKKFHEPEVIVTPPSYDKPNFNQLIETTGLQSLRNRNKRPVKTKPQSLLWKGFIITASDGKLIDYELPGTKIDKMDLSTSKINCIEKYGYKSIIVSICNILEIFYLGNDKLIEDDIYYSGNKADVWSILEDEARKDPLQSRPNQTINSELLFINKRRKMKDRTQMLPI